MPNEDKAYKYKPGGMLTPEEWRNLATTTEGPKQVGGDHYKKHKIQPFDVIDEYNMGFYDGNALKYLMRYREKGGIEDLLKAQHYIEILISKEKYASRP